MRIKSLYSMMGTISRSLSLRYVDFSFNNLSGGTHPKHMTTMIANNKKLESINFNECYLGEAHLLAIAKGILPQNKYEKIILSGNSMLNDAMISFGEAFRQMKCTHLRWLDLGMNPKVSDEGCVGFYNAVKNTAKLTLETLILRNNANLS